MLFFYRVVSVTGLVDHLKGKHGVPVDISIRTFNSFCEFANWKEEEERVTHSWYVMHNAPKVINDYQHYYYYCNRAGVYKSRGNGKRALKSQGTCKINSSYSAYTKAVRCLKTDSVSLTYTSTHYNHQQQLGHLRLNDLISVASIIEEMQTSIYNAVLLFKQQDEEPSDRCMLLDDFLVVFQTEFQRDMLAKHGHKGVCMDATYYNVNDYDFHLITLIVLDDYQEGIPVAWAISNREDRVVLKYILESIKLKCGSFTSSSWFMSDMAPQYFNAWKEVFDTSNTKYLWCAWHIDRAWRKAVKKYFNTLDEQREVYHQLCVLLMETSKPYFQVMLTKFLTSHCNSLSKLLPSL